MKFSALVFGLCASILLIGPPNGSFAGSSSNKDKPLPAVQGVRAAANAELIRLRWQPVPGSDGYRIYCEKEQDGFQDTFRLDVPAASPNFEFNDAQPGVKYTFRISALGKGGEGLPSLPTTISLKSTATFAPSDAAR